MKKQTPKMDKREIAQLVSDIMRIGKMTQKQLAKVLGVTQGAVHHWVTGTHVPYKATLETLKDLKVVLDAGSKVHLKQIARELKNDPSDLPKTLHKSIAMQAHAIVNERAEEKERQYGDFHECMRRANNMLKEMTRIEDLPESTMYFAMIALKLSREGYHHKTDNLLDAMAYMQALENLHLGNDVHCSE